MIREICFCGVDAVEHVHYSQDTLAISVLDCLESASRPHLGNR